MHNLILSYGSSFDKKEAGIVFYGIHGKNFYISLNESGDIIPFNEKELNQNDIKSLIKFLESHLE